MTVVNSMKDDISHTYLVYSGTSMLLFEHGFLRIREAVTHRRVDTLKSIECTFHIIIKAVERTKCSGEKLLWESLVIT